MTVRQFSALVQSMPRDTVFWRLVAETPQRVEGQAARDVLRNL
jgi:hypothetical protein